MQFAGVAEPIRLDDDSAGRLGVPHRATVVTSPFRWDDYDAVPSLFGYRVRQVVSTEQERPPSRR